MLWNNLTDTAPRMVSLAGSLPHCSPFDSLILKLIFEEGKFLWFTKNNLYQNIWDKSKIKTNIFLKRDFFLSSFFFSITLFCLYYWGNVGFSLLHSLWRRVFQLPKRGRSRFNFLKCISMKTQSRMYTWCTRKYVARIFHCLNEFIVCPSFVWIFDWKF